MPSLPAAASCLGDDLAGRWSALLLAVLRDLGGLDPLAPPANVMSAEMVLVLIVVVALVGIVCIWGDTDD